MNKGKAGIRIMKFRNIIMELALVSTMVLTSACGSSNTGEERVPVSLSEEDLKMGQDLEQSSERKSGAEEDTEGVSDKIETATLETIAELLEKSELQAAEVFGGGEENWTEDKRFYIGRIYRVSLFDEEVTIYTSYDDKQLVNSVSIWLVNWEQNVKEEDAMQWVERLSEFTGTKPDVRDTVSEGGSKNWKWFLEDRAVTLYWQEDMLTISMNVMVGELD